MILYEHDWNTRDQNEIALEMRWKQSSGTNDVLRENI